MPVLAILALLGSLISLCAGTSYAKQLFPVIGAAGTTSYRLFFSAMLLTLLWRPWRRHWGRADLVPLLLYGGTLGCMNLFFYLTLETIPFGLALAIEFTGPLAVALWSSKRKLDFVWIALAAMGLAYLLPWPGSASNLDPRGIGFALLASLCWALYIVFGKEAATRYGGFATPMGILIAALVVTPVGIYSAGSTLLTPSLLLAGVVVAVVSSAVPYSLEMYALRHLPRQTFSTMLSLEPLVGAMAGWLFLSESLHLSQVVAMGAIVLACVGSASMLGNTQAASEKG